MESNWVNQDGFCYLIPFGMPPVSIRTVYLFYEIPDVSVKLSDTRDLNFQSAALVVMGYLPRSENVCAVYLTFKNARFRTLFGFDMPAIVLTCRVSLWLKGLDATFLVIPPKVMFTFKSRDFSCSESIFSLNRFCKITGFRTNVRSIQTRYDSIS